MPVSPQAEGVPRSKQLRVDVEKLDFPGIRKVANSSPTVSCSSPSLQVTPPRKPRAPWNPAQVNAMRAVDLKPVGAEERMTHRQNKFSPADRAEIAKMAIAQGATKAARHFSAILNLERPIPMATVYYMVRSLKDKAESEGVPVEEVKEMAAKKNSKRRGSEGPGPAAMKGHSMSLDELTDSDFLDQKDRLSE